MGNQVPKGIEVQGLSPFQSCLLCCADFHFILVESFVLRGTGLKPRLLQTMSNLPRILQSLLSKLNPLSLLNAAATIKTILHAQIQGYYQLFIFFPYSPFLGSRTRLHSNQPYCLFMFIYTEMEEVWFTSANSHGTPLSSYI